MATIKCTLGQNSSYYEVYIEYSYTQNVTNNTSTVTAALKLKKTTGYNFDTESTVTASFVMNGTTYKKTARVKINDGKPTGTVYTLVSGQQTIDHNNDGTKQITFSCSNTSSLWNCAGWGPGSITLSSTKVTLPTIPRAATLDKITNTSGTTVSSINAGTDIRVYYTPKSTSFYHRLTYTLGSKTGTVNLGKVSSTSMTHQTISDVDASWLPAATSGTMTCKITTYSDSAYTKSVGSASKTITVNIPNTESYKPSAKLDLTPGTKSAPGYGHELGEFYLQNKSKVTLIATATIKGGTSIASLAISGGTSASGTTTLLEKEVSLTSAGNISYTATVKDKRGRTASDIQTITVLAYSAPTYSKMSVVRCDENNVPNATGTCALCKITTSVTSLKPSDEEVNTQKVIVQYRQSGFTDWEEFDFRDFQNNLTNSEIEIFNNNITIKPDTAYEFRFVIKDELSEINTSVSKIQSVGRPFNIAKYNNGIALGKMSTVTDKASEGLVELGWGMKVADDRHYADEKYGIDMQNSDIINANGIYFADQVTNPSEGLIFANGAANTYDWVCARDGIFYFAPAITDLNTFPKQYTPYIKTSKGDSGATTSIVYIYPGDNPDGSVSKSLAFNKDRLYIADGDNSGTVDLGSSNRRWKNLYLSGDATIGGKAQFQSVTGAAGYGIVTRTSKSTDADGNIFNQMSYINTLKNAAGTTYIRFSCLLGDNTTHSNVHVPTSASDVRLKDNIQDCDINALEIVSQMNIRQFDWINGSHQKIGFVADELEKLDPRLTVGGGYDNEGNMDTKSVDSFYLLGYVAKAVQELAAQVQDLTEQNNELRKKVQKLEEKNKLKE